MAKENIEKLKAAVKADQELCIKMNETLGKVSPEKRAEAFSAFAAEAGFPFTAEEFREYQLQGQEISDEELEAVSGGKHQDWLKDGCTATVELGSWCWSDDWCYTWDSTYSHEPVQKCPKCGGIMYLDHMVSVDQFEVKCKSCGYTEVLFTPAG